jgi:hypothetical protein
MRAIRQETFGGPEVASNQLGILRSQASDLLWITIHASLAIRLQSTSGESTPGNGFEEAKFR